MTDRVSGYSKGFGFVRYATLEDAANGIEGMDGKVSLLFTWISLLFTAISFNDWEKWITF